MESPEFRLNYGKLEGSEVKRLMRKHRKTIRELSGEMAITMKRIRQVRESGLQDCHAIRDWVQAILGGNPGPTRRKYRGAI